jgi:hypothetical protein
MYSLRDLARELVDPVRGDKPHHERLHRRVLAILTATLCLEVAATLLMFSFHGLEKSRSLDELGDAAVWSASQLLAGGSSLSTSSFIGHVLEVVLELWALTFVAALAASVAAFLQQNDTQPELSHPNSGSAGEGKA